MGSVGNQSPWLSYENYRDCSLEICSIYCPQFCYLLFPPPPRPSDDESGGPFSPLIIAIIGVLASAFLLVSYYTLVTRYCKRRTNNIDHNLETEENHDELARDDQWQQTGSNGLDESLIEKITVCKYEKGGGGGGLIIEGTECAVCLSEFQENESLRLLPKCNHAFHLPCIDMWLKSHSNCPLCRANVLPAPAVNTNSQASPALNANPYEIQRPDDLVLVVDGLRGRRPDSRVVVISGDDDDRNEEEEQVAGVEQRFRRSVSLGTFPPQQHLVSISDILRFEEIDEYVQVEIDQLWRGIGSWEGGGSEWSSKGKDGRLLRSPPVAMKRSVSTTGRFIHGESKVNDKGKNFMIPN